MTLAKCCYSAGKSVFGVAQAIVQWAGPTMWPNSWAKCLPDPYEKQQQPT